jgi:hypothetical protein
MPSPLDCNYGAGQQTGSATVSVNGKADTASVCLRSEFQCSRRLRWLLIVAEEMGTTSNVLRQKLLTRRAGNSAEESRPSEKLVLQRALII